MLQLTHLTVILNRLCHHMPAGQQSSGGKGSSVYNPQSLLSAVCCHAPVFKGKQQHDSHELMRMLLDGLQVRQLGWVLSDCVQVRVQTWTSCLGGGCLWCIAMRLEFYSSSWCTATAVSIYVRCHACLMCCTTWLSHSQPTCNLHCCCSCKNSATSERWQSSKMATAAAAAMTKASNPSSSNSSRNRSALSLVLPVVGSAIAVAAVVVAAAALNQQLVKMQKVPLLRLNKLLVAAVAVALAKSIGPRVPHA